MFIEIINLHNTDKRTQTFNSTVGRLLLGGGSLLVVIIGLAAAFYSHSVYYHALERDN